MHGSTDDSTHFNTVSTTIQKSSTGANFALLGLCSSDKTICSSFGPLTFDAAVTSPPPLSLYQMFRLRQARRADII